MTICDPINGKTATEIRKALAAIFFNSSSVVKRLASACGKNIPKIKKIKTAENLTMFLPGAGQVYAGRPGEGTLNFLIQLSCLAFGAHQLSNGFTTFQFWNAFPFTGYLGGIGMWNKIYQGGIKRAGIIAEETNQHRIADFNHNINYLIIGTLDQ